MEKWSPRAFKKRNKDSSQAVVDLALFVGGAIKKVSPNIPVIFTLKHLALLSGSSYKELRSFVDRSVTRPYRSFLLRKRGYQKNNIERRYRAIKVPIPPLKVVQSYINTEILSQIKPHHCSVAYAPGCSIYEAAKKHCNSRWLLKFDITNFFDSVTEKQVYSVFRRCGYPALLSFEMARICTAHKTRAPVNWGKLSPHTRYETIPGYSNNRLGTLPQGTPTSPMLANLVCFKMDSRIESIATEYLCDYTRYADDMTLSTDQELTRKQVSEIIGKVRGALNNFGYQMNSNKTTIVTPGARKIYLGLNVTDELPKLRKEYKRRINQHLFFCEKKDVGPEAHSKHIGFVSVVGFKNHLKGLLDHAAQVEPSYAATRLDRFKNIDWPL